ncbi:MAG TPA: hypothetical protein VKD22_16185 [Ramlibacter sp.]|nr:hypothetical protein [Ramlibacter sp.]
MRWRLAYVLAAAAWGVQCVALVWVWIGMYASVEATNGDSGLQDENGNLVAPAWLMAGALVLTCSGLIYLVVVGLAFIVHGWRYTRPACRSCGACYDCMLYGPTGELWLVPTLLGGCPMADVGDDQTSLCGIVVFLGLVVLFGSGITSFLLGIEVERCVRAREAGRRREAVHL